MARIRKECTVENLENILSSIQIIKHYYKTIYVDSSLKHIESLKQVITDLIKHINNKMPRVLLVEYLDKLDESIRNFYNGHKE